jgi:hypothetical protein
MVTNVSASEKVPSDRLSQAADSISESEKKYRDILSQLYNVQKKITLFRESDWLVCLSCG